MPPMDMADLIPMFDPEHPTVYEIGQLIHELALLVNSPNQPGRMQRIKRGIRQLARLWWWYRCNHPEIDSGWQT